MNDYFYYSIILKDDSIYHTEGFDLSDAIDNIIDEQCASIQTRRVIIKDDFLKNIKRVIAKNNVSN